MGTTFSVRIARPRPDTDGAALAGEVDAVLRRIDEQTSAWRADSDLSRLNAAPAGRPEPVGPDLFAVLTTARDVTEATEGAFDVTVGPLVRLWGFGPGGGPRRVPAEAEIEAARAAVGMTRVTLDPAARTVTRLDAAATIDVDAIAPGYAVDRICDLLDGRGLTDYLVELGGEVRARGHSARGRPWRIGIEAPTPDRRPIHATVPLADAALATSGNYRSRFIHQGVEYGHTIDPHTGRPTGHDLLSASVVTTTCERADALATAVMVLGPDTGLALAEREGFEVLLIVRGPDGRLIERTSPGWPGPDFAGEPSPSPPAP